MKDLPSSQIPKNWSWLWMHALYFMSLTGPDYKRTGEVKLICLCSGYPYLYINEIDDFGSATNCHTHVT